MTASARISPPERALDVFPGADSQNTQRPPSAAPMKRMSLSEDAAMIARRAQYERGAVPKTRLSGSEGAAKLRLDLIAALIGPKYRTAKQVVAATGFTESDVGRALLELVRVFRLQRTPRRAYRYFQLTEVVE